MCGLLIGREITRFDDSAGAGRLFTNLKTSYHQRFLLLRWCLLLASLYLCSRLNGIHQGLDLLVVGRGSIWLLGH